MQNKYLYFDNAATTKPSASCLKAFKQASSLFYNPSSLYLPSAEIKSKIEQCRLKINRLLNGRTDGKIIFTSSATESNNWIINSQVRRKDKKYIFSVGEHSSVYNCAKKLKEQGYNIMFIPLQKNGSVDYEQLYKEIDSKTEFVSIIHVNNETGAINDIAAISKQIKSINPNTLIHSDGVQAIGKTDVNLNKLNVDFYTFSGHKINATKGAACLYVAYINKIVPFIYGGGQELGLRGGTENFAAILSITQALENILNNKNNNRLTKLNQRLIAKLDRKIDYINLSDDNCVPNIIALCFKNIRGETLQHMLEEKSILVGVGSACNSKHQDYRVLDAMKIADIYKLGCIRISFDKNTTYKQIDILADAINEVVLQYLKRTAK